MRYGLALLCLTTTALAGDLDGRIKHEQAQVDNEAVVVYGGTIGDQPVLLFLEWCADCKPAEMDGRLHFLTVDEKAPPVGLELANPKPGELQVLIAAGADPRRTSLVGTGSLVKAITHTHVTWVGSFTRQDGVVLKMHFRRPR